MKFCIKLLFTFCIFIASNAVAIVEELPLLDRGTQEALQIIESPAAENPAGKLLFYGMQADEYLPYLRQRVLIIDKDDRWAHTAVISSDMSLEEIDIQSIALDDFDLNALPLEDYDLVVQTEPSEIGRFPLTDDFITIREDRLKAFLRGNIAWRHLHQQPVAYPILAIDFGEQTRVIYQETVYSNEELVDTDFLSAGLSKQDILDAVLATLRNRDIDVKTLFAGHQDRDQATQYVIDEQTEESVDRQILFMLGGFHTATSLYRRLPGAEILFNSEGRSLTYEEKTRRYLRYGYELGKGLKTFADHNITPLRMRPGYWLQLFRLEGLDLAGGARFLLRDLWVEYCDKEILLPEWIIHYQQQWTEAGSPLTFVEWMMEQVWANSGSPLDFDQWTYHICYGAPTDDTYQDWYNKHMERLYERWNEHPLGLSFDEYDAINMRRVRSATWLSMNSWKYQLDHQAIQSEEPLETYILTRYWEQALDDGTTSATLDEWLADHVVHDTSRWQELGFEEAGINLEEFRRMQSYEWYGADRPLTALDAELRKAFRITIEDGHAFRNGRPFHTQEESTFHSGKGFAVFVMDCHGNLYSASHGNTFFHSSFMADGPVMMAGEMRTDANGRITYLSNKSGHYIPGNDAIVRMLTYFSTQGLDLTHVAFEEFFGGSATYTGNAQEFLDKLVGEVKVAHAKPNRPRFH